MWRQLLQVNVVMQGSFETRLGSTVRLRPAASNSSSISSVACESMSTA
jgi:hypothetical protein